MAENLTSFEELKCWKACSQLRKDLKLLIEKFPNDEKFRLTDQIVRCSRSITNNIAEGFGRYHFQENAQFCRQSRGSLYELIDHLLIAKDEGYISEEQLSVVRNDIDHCLALINGYINYLMKRKVSAKNN